MHDRASDDRAVTAPPHLRADAPARREPDDTPVGDSDAFQRVLRRIERYAPFDHISVLFEGESGTGKTILARYLHRCSGRADKPFVLVDAGALDDDLAGSALFGHVKGAFTGATAARTGLFFEAAGGTVFLDEIGKASMHIQRRLLGAVESHEVTPLGANRPMRVVVRVVAATNVLLEDLVERGLFLPDLAARIRACTIRLPPLRDHKTDIPLLVRHFVERFAPVTRYANPPAVCDRLMTALVRAPWKENVRELSFAVQRLLIEAYPAKTLRLEHCDDELRHLREFATRSLPRANAEQLAQLVEERGSVRDAARELGMSLATAYRRLSGPRPATPAADPPALSLRLSQLRKDPIENSQLGDP